jgi:hypothetical protein
MKLKYLIGFILLVFISFAAYSQEAEITRIREILSLRAYADFRLILFEQASEESYFLANKPLNLGLGVGILGLVIKFTFSIPIMYEQPKKDGFSFDFKIDSYGTSSYTYGYVQYNSDFIHIGSPDVGMKILNVGLSYESIFNKNHSLRSAYVLDRRQSISNGSFLMGAGIFYSRMKSDNTANRYQTQNYLYFGPNLGFSYTWIFNGSLFLNILPVVGVNLMISFDDHSLAVGLQGLPKLSFGYHGNKWSWNIYFTGSYLFAYPTTDKRMHLFSGNIGTTVIWRIL